MNSSHKTKVLLLTGASGGLGRALVTLWSKSDWQLILHCHRDRDLLEEHLARLDFRHAPTVLQADLSAPEEVLHLCGEAQKKAGRVDVLVNNAGLSHSAVLWKQDIDVWNQLLAVNLTAPFLMMRHLSPGMRSRGFGRIINISSVVAHLGVFGASAYGASKAGLNGLVASASKELISGGVTVNNIALGYTSEGMIDQLQPEHREEIRVRIPAQRFGSAEELAGLIAYLASDQAAYLTGQTLHLNGGLYA